MSTFRFTLMAVGLFAMAFIGISWANKGFPVIAMRSEPAKPVAQITQTPAPVVEDKSVPAKTVDPVTTFEEYGKKAARKEWENSKTGQGDGDPKREALRLATLQAANAFALSLCDATMKKNLVEALTKYTSAWSEMAGCRNGFCGDDKKLDAAAAAFHTPADVRVHETLREAFEKGGIGKDDFPKAVRDDVYVFTRMPFGEPDPVCGGGRRAETLR